MAAIEAKGFVINGQQYCICSAISADYAINDAEGNEIKQYTGGTGISVDNDTHVISYVGGGGGGIEAVQHDSTLTGDGASQTTLLGVTPGIYAEPNGNYSANGLTALSANGAYSAKNANMATNVQYVNSVPASTVISRLNGLTAQSATWNDVTAKANQTDLSNEVTAREYVDGELQAQIDAITSQTDVVDVVGSHVELLAYDTSTLYVDDIVKVLVDETRDDAITYYRWKGSDASPEWLFIGASGPFYTKSETDTTFIAKNSTSASNWNSTYTTVNSNSANWNTTVTANDPFVDVSKGSGPDYTIASKFRSVTAMPSSPEAGCWYFIVE